MVTSLGIPAITGESGDILKCMSNEREPRGILKFFLMLLPSSINLYEYPRDTYVLPDDATC